MKELEPCWICGSTEFLYVARLGEDLFAVQCERCPLQELEARSEEAAIARWNEALLEMEGYDLWQEGLLRSTGLLKEFRILDALCPDDWRSGQKDPSSSGEFILMIARGNGGFDLDLAFFTGNEFRVNGLRLPPTDRVIEWQPFMPKSPFFLRKSIASPRTCLS